MGIIFNSFGGRREGEYTRKKRGIELYLPPWGRIHRSEIHSRKPKQSNKILVIELVLRIL